MDQAPFAEGGYGSAFLAKDKQSGRTVVVKKMVVKDRSTEAALMKEIQIMKELDHPNICKLLEVFISGSHAFLVLEYCQGGELFDRIMSETMLSEAVTRDIIGQVAQALKHAHSR